MVLTRLLIVLAALLVVSCSDEANRSATPDPSHATTVGEAEGQDQPGQGVLITKAEYGEDWPYTVDSGFLYCDPPGSNVVLKADGTVYALNGRAMGNAAEKGYLDARESITLKDENGYFTVGNVGKIIERGLAMCN